MVESSENNSGMIIHSIHGFNVDDEGGATTDTLTPLFEAKGCAVVEHNYPDFFLVRKRLCNPAMATMVRDQTKPGESIIAHSNGAAIVYLAAKAGAHFGHVVLVNPALNSKLAIPNAASVDVWYSPSDPWTTLARFVPWSIWGSQGRTGYTGKPVGIEYRQYNEDQIFDERVRHSGMFSCDERRQMLVEKTLERIY